MIELIKVWWHCLTHMHRMASMEWRCRTHGTKHIHRFCGDCGYNNGGVKFDDLNRKLMKLDAEQNDS